MMYATPRDATFSTRKFHLNQILRIESSQALSAVDVENFRPLKKYGAVAAEGAEALLFWIYFTYYFYYPLLYKILHLHFNFIPRLT